MQQAAIPKRSFEVERLIFFSDAVFAIALTLLVLDIRFPEGMVDKSSGIARYSFRPMMIQLGAFAISFLFIASMWYQHLKLFRFLLRFDRGLVIRNFFFIFFIVCFPFVMSGVAKNVQKDFLLPVLLYMANIALSVFAQFILCRYLLVTKPSLCFAGSEHQKKYMLMRAKWTSVVFLITLMACILTYVISKGKLMAFVLSVYLLPVLLFVSRIFLRKYRVAAEADVRK